MFLDHDDELLPHAVETLRAELQAFPEAGAAFADHEYRDIKRGIQFTDHHVSQRAFHRLRGVTAERISPQGRLYSTNLYSALLSGNLLQQPWMIRRELFLTLDGFDESIKYCEDWEMYLRVTRDASVVLHDEVISIHWVEGDNLHLSPDQTDMQLRVLQKRLMKERISNPRLAWLVRKRIAQLFKFQGDCLSVQDLESAWHSYFQSAAHWPYDFVVFLRLAWWTTKLGARNFRKYLGCAKDSCLTQ